MMMSQSGLSKGRLNHGSGMAQDGLLWSLLIGPASTLYVQFAPLVSPLRHLAMDVAVLDDKALR